MLFIPRMTTGRVNPVFGLAAHGLLTAALALVFAAAGWCAGTTLAQDKQRPESIVVAIDDNYPPYIFRGQDGRVQGYLVDEWKLWSEKTGVRAEIVATDWDKAQQIMAEGKADVIDTIFFSESRAKTLDFTKGYARLAVPVYYHRTLTGITDVSSLKGFSVAVKSGDSCIEVLRKNGIQTFREYPSYEDIIKAAGVGEIKVFVVDEPPALYYLYKYGLDGEFRYAFTLYSGEFHRAVKKGRADLLSLVESGFSAITPAEREDLHKKWLGAPLGDSRFFRTLIYSLGGVGAAALLLGFFNLALRRRVRAKTAELDALMRELAKSEERYRLLFDMESDAILLTSIPDGAIIEANQAARQMYGYSASEMRRLTAMDLSMEPDKTAKTLRDGELSVPLRWHRRKNGEAFAVEITSRHFDLENRPLRISALRDVTGRMKTEQALIESRKLLETIINSVPSAVFWKDLDSVYLGCNKVFAKDAGLEDPWQIIGMNDLQLPWNQTDAFAYIADDREVMEGGRAKERIIEQVRQAGGATIWVETTKVPLIDDEGRVFGVLGAYEDITERKLHEERIESSLREKEILLKEVHHRVKNNLQVLSSLINLQAQSLAGKAEIEPFRIMQNRVRSISLVHESLYRSPDLGAVAMRDYLPGLAGQIVTAYGEAAKNIRLDLCVDDISLGVDKGIPLGLLVTELLTNALKHAFAPGEEGEVRLTLSDQGESCLLSIEDNGVGLPENFSLGGGETLGVQLLSALASQLGGELRFGGQKATRFEVVFPK